MAKSETKARVVFLPSGKRGSFAIGTPILQAARSLGVDLDSVCGGRALCGRCQVVVPEGEFPKHALTSRAANVSAAGATERRYGERRGWPVSGRRLGCQALILGDLVVDVPPDSQVHRQVVRKRAEHRDITLDAAVRLHYVEVRPAELPNPAGDAERLCEALRKEWNLEGLAIDTAVLPGLQAALRSGSWAVTAVVHDEATVIAVWPGFHQAVYGAAIDIGSTTIAAHVCDLTTGEVVGSGGIMNPQIRFGEDLMSRVSWVQMQPQGADELTRAVRDGINALLDEVAAEAGIAVDRIVEASVVGNPIMHHLFLGISPVELGSAPFTLAVESSLSIRAADVGLRISDAGRIYILPCIAGHVGADAAAMVLAEEPQLSDEVSLLVDVGTNAEIVLGNSERLYACSSPTGPAFEGAQISCGQRAAPGAIERVRVDPESLEVRFSVIGSDAWSDDTGFPDVIAGIGVTGICGSGIIEAIAEMFLAGVVTPEGVIDGGLAHRSARLIPEGRTWSFLLYDGQPRIVVTQTDVRQVQLAKAALYAGTKLLLDRAGYPAVDRIRLAGAFGSHIDPRYAMVLGLIPDCALDRVASAGNAAGTGARIALLNRAARREIEAIVREICKIETAVEPGFQKHFVEAMSIPHGADSFPALFGALGRHPPAAGPGGRSSPRRRRRSGAA